MCIGDRIYVPLIGLAWWALDFPFLRRQTKGDLRRNPNQRLADRQATLRACERFARLPTSVVSFAEGTRFTAAKHQGSPYRHLLKPKAGALALTLGAMGGRFHSLLDATIVYPDGAPTFWAFLCGRVPRIVVRVREEEVTAGEPGDAAERVSNLSRAYRVNLTVLALVALFTGAFLLFSVLSLSVARRAP